MDAVVGLKSACVDRLGHSGALEHQILVCALGVVGTEAGHLHEGKGNRQATCGAEGEAYGRRDLGHAGSLGIVIFLIAR